MSEKKIKYLTDSDGNKSAMRMMCAFSLAVSIVLAFSEAFGVATSDGTTQLILYFLVAAFAPKAVQKFAETEK